MEQPHGSHHAQSSARLETLGLMLAMVAHELNNVLTPVLASAQLARKRPDDPELTSKAVARAEDGCTRAAAMLRMVLGLSRDGVLESFEPADVAAAAASVVCGLGEVDAVVRCEVAAGCRAAAPAVVVEQVLHNLVHNAQRAMRTSRVGSQVLVSAMIKERRVQIIVSDDGPGIPGAIKERLFEPFNSSELASGQGTGLGLLICKRLVEEFGGAIRVESESTVGTTIVIELPAAADVSVRSAA